MVGQENADNNLDGVYRPISGQLARLVDSPELADPSVVEGFRTLIRDGVQTGRLGPNEGSTLLDHCEIVDALHTLERHGILTD